MENKNRAITLWYNNGAMGKKIIFQETNFIYKGHYSVVHRFWWNFICMFGRKCRKHIFLFFLVFLFKGWNNVSKLKIEKLLIEITRKWIWVINYIDIICIFTIIIIVHHFNKPLKYYIKKLLLYEKHLYISILMFIG